jgi:hypothetical protein
VLAGLVEQRGDAPQAARTGSVVPLRRRLAQVLVAAAAVTVIGVGTTQLIGGLSGGDTGDDATSGSVGAMESDTADDAGEGADAGGDTANAPEESGGGQAEAPSRALLLDPADLAELPVVRPARLAPDLTRLADAPEAARQQDFAARVDGRVALTELPCGPVFHAEHERRVWVRFRDRLGLVLYYPTVEGRQQVEVFDCEGPTPRRAAASVLIPANR